ncbi:zinc finger BED domain-containing protein RICESLEEPER 2-like [Gossypium hirsutum]|uniref:Zinc finger BED domain-containing protein RICESLEEPER 2-like n=1 Tax=Gossypium hirsutum TaxID=3635 RepID=A0ABM2YVG4_GOSHI|nr:zinc finger BED domain-containing protein RICESLEEPER 2-like [Gossypium hirsutum]
MSTEPTSIEGSVTPPTSIDFENSRVGASSQANVTTGKRKATPQSHKGESIGMMIEKCLLNWGIDKLFTITVDNASSNDVAIGLKEMNKSVERVRGAVRHVRQSPARLQKFKECVVVEKIECKKMLCLDVSTRWNSTYLMLDTAQNFERAFERFQEQDTNFRAELERGEGWPSVDDWANVRDLRDFLEHFYEVTLSISGTSYVTSNNFFDELSKIDILLRDAQLNSNVDFNVMAIKMKENTCSQSSVPTHVSLGEPQQKMKRRMQALYKKRELEICGEDKTSELDKYLAEANEEFVEDFDILL